MPTRPRRPEVNALLGVAYAAAPVATGVVAALWAGAGFAGFVIGAALALGGIYMLLLRHFREIETVIDTAERLAAGQPMTLAPKLSSIGAEAVAAAITRLQRALETDRGHASRRDAEAAAMLDALPDPALTLDGDRHVLRANYAATAFFGVNPEGRDLGFFLRHPDVLAAIDAVISGGERNREVEYTPPGAAGRFWRARVTIPAAQSAGSVAAVVTLHDVTAARRLEAMRVDFVANASHELRTPLASLIGFVETLQGPARDDEGARDRFLGIMHDQARRMSRLVQDLLSLSQIELNEHREPKGAVDMARLARRVADLLQVTAAAKGVTILVEAPPGLPPVAGSEDELVQVLQNLIDNAVKYGPADSEVVVTIVPEPAEGPARDVVVSVADSGEGIPAEHIPRLTERFYRVDSARSRKLGGTGLGLAIVKHIVAHHRGQLTIRSTLGEGSEFRVQLPVATEAPVT
ncbi:MAG: PAS domain-containing protein [Alphaproteobacteria bacterium]|jgi:two-component system phosphate regulon sensor histidine kinase PhoR|nr:PAS domain-containing protein [Alphaproteobacteria bacterium]